jgi:hypothetical protein
MPKVAFLIPASPARSFFSQIAAFAFALKRLPWKRWEPSVLVCLGSEPDDGSLAEWRPHLNDVAFVSVPKSHENIPWFYAQIDGVFRWAPRDADVLVRVDADTLPVGDFEDVLDYVWEQNAIAGVMAHFAFPSWPGMSSRDSWAHAADGLITEPLDFRQAYSLTPRDVPEDHRLAPFYVNDGAFFIPGQSFDAFSRLFLDLRPRVMERLSAPYFSGQIAISLAVTQMRARTCALPMRYNFPNDEMAAARFPEELENVKIFHYLRTDRFDRQRLFAEAGNYREFLCNPLSGVNEVFRRTVLETIGPEFPFGFPAAT